jgi:hypothetical protein
LRLSTRQVNVNSRNPLLLPIFLSVVPKAALTNPQLIHMLSGSRDRYRALSRTRRTIAACGAATALAVVLLAAGGLSVHGSAKAGGAPRVTPSRTPVTSAPISQLAAATADAALGLRTPFYEPPTVPDPATPGMTIVAGTDQPDPFMLVSCWSTAAATTSSPHRTG